MRDRRRESHRVQDRPAANHHHIAAPVQIGCVHRFQHPHDRLQIVLDRLSSGNHLNRRFGNHPVLVVPSERGDTAQQIGLSFGHVLVDPELDARQLARRRFEQIGQHLLIRAEDVVGKAQPMHKRHGERHVDAVIWFARGHLGSF